ncbi:MAG TPA: uroporphyrinogen-III synthase [Acidimicrobiales bacterium]|nr:uroporphyrinogen-III synthase [Acidimicrobiales bacterium]
MSEVPDLSGRTVGVTADRRGEDQAVMFRRMGAEVVLGPTIATVKVPDPDLLRRRSDELIADPPDYLIANTGVGMRTWLEAASVWGTSDALVAALGRTRIAARGPKVAGALSSAGLPAWWRSPNEQLGQLIEHLAGEGLDGTRVWLQLHGDDGAEFVARLEAEGATVTTVPVYVWTRPPDPAPALDLIERTAGGRVDALSFTAGPQIRSLFELAAEAGQELGLRTAVSGPVVTGCIGPVCAAVAGEYGISDPVVPANWRLGSLVKAVAEELARRR